MVEYKNAGLFTADNVTKEARIEYSAGVIGNEELFQNSEELTEVLCTGGELRFGQCNSSSFKFKVANIVKKLTGEWLTFSLVLDHDEENPFVVGRYRVESETLTADRMHREVVAYDAMRDILLADVTGWYNALLPDTREETQVTLRSFRSSFARHFGIEQEDVELANDGMQVRRTIEPDRLSGKDVIQAICEVSGCFGRIGRDGRLRYVRLRQNAQGLYPAEDLFPDRAPGYLTVQEDAGHLYPQSPGSRRFGSGGYISCRYDDFVTKQINKVQIRLAENDIGKIWPETGPSDRDNCYIVQDNFLLYGKSPDELSAVAQNLLGAIKGVAYRPFAAECAGNPCLEVGDPVRFLTKFDIVESYIFERRMKGIQALRDTYAAKGAERYAEKVNGVHRSIVQLNGKANVIERTVDETRIEMRDMGEGLSSQILMTSRQIVLKTDARGRIVQVALGADPETGTEFRVDADNISLSANDVMDLMSGGTLNLTAKNLNITSTNFEVNQNGDVKCRNITAFSISGNAVTQFSHTVDNSEAMNLAKQAIAEARNAAAKANEAAVKANEAAVKANEAAVKANEVAVTANNAAVKANEVAVTASNAAAKANEAIVGVNVTVNNLKNTIIPDLNAAIEGVSRRVAVLEAKG